jgi:pimeloyl-ACP methyl ester carboxylesterase
MVLFLLFLAASFLGLAPGAIAQSTGGEDITDGKFSYVPPEIGFEYPAPDPSDSGMDGLEEIEIPGTWMSTGDPEMIHLSVPDSPPPVNGYPLMVCWHGYKQSHTSVAEKSKVDEECAERNWVFLSILGVNQVNFGYLQAQIHCTEAIDYLITELAVPVDLNSIYMAGFSMGAGAAASYASRHMSAVDKYPVAGLILVCPLYDWIDAYEAGDVGVQTYMPILLGGTPSEVPFKYKQISTLRLVAHEYVLEESMGQNLAHNMPVFITYADNDPIGHLPPQNLVFIDMMTDLGANYVLDFHAFSLDPHSWTLLDTDAAFDFLANYTLPDQNPLSIQILADRSATFYWAEINSGTLEVFSQFQANIFPVHNKMVVLETSNVDRMGADLSQIGLGNHKDLLIDYRSTYEDTQIFEIVPVDTEPTYVVDANGVLFPGYTYDPGEEKIVYMLDPPISEFLKNSFEPYNLTLIAPPTAKLGEIVTIELSGGSPSDFFILILSLVQKELKVGQGHILVDPFPPLGVMIQYYLDDQGNRTMEPRIPGDPLLVGTAIYEQFLTFDSYLKEISNLQSTVIEE